MMQRLLLKKTNVPTLDPGTRQERDGILRRFTCMLMLVTGLFAAAPRPATAQGAFDMGVLTNTVSQGAIVKSERERARRMKSPAGTRSMASGKTTRALFAPSAAVRKRSIDRCIAVLRASDPQMAATIAKEFATKDIFGTMSKQLAPYGLQTNSLTDAMTVYLMTAWQAVHGDTSDPTKAQVTGLRKQIGLAFGDIPAINAAPGSAKQEMADALLLQTVLLSANLEWAKTKPDQMKLLQSRAAAGARATIGFDLASLRMTEKGLQK